MMHNRRRRIESKGPPRFLTIKDKSQISFIGKLKGYMHSHHLAFSSAIYRLFSQPFRALTISFVVAIALSLPSGLYVAVMNLQKIANIEDSSTTVTVFLKMSATQPEINALQENLLLDKNIATVSYISSQQGLDDFRIESGFGDVLDILDENPLPAVLLVQPKTGAEYDSNFLKQLASKLRTETLIENVEVDIVWLNRLKAILAIAESLSLMLGAVLSFGVLLIIGNVISLALDNRRNEVVVVKLIGGTNAYIRRPFLYTGFWYGVIGGFLAWVFVAIALYWMSIPVARLAELYHSFFKLEGLGFFGLIALVSVGSALGLLGAWLSVTRQLSTIEPK